MPSGSFAFVTPAGAFDTYRCRNLIDAFVCIFQRVFTLDAFTNSSFTLIFCLTDSSIVNMAAEKLQLQDEVEMLAAELQCSQLQRDELEKQNRENLGSLISVVERKSSVAESAIINLQKKGQNLQENLR